MRSLEGPLFDIWGHWETGWWSKKLIEISIKVDSTLKNLFFFHEKFKFERNFSDATNMNLTHLEVGRIRWK